MIYFIGAGPGAVDLITVRGRDLLERAEVVIYAGSLVSKEHLEYCRPDAKIYNSAGMTLEDVMEVMTMEEQMGKTVVRLHTGDPSIYGAIREQMVELDRVGIQYEVIPGVSSFTGAAAAINREFTLPGVTQTVILTRVEGRTPVPKTEDLEILASVGASMAIFLSISMIDKVVDKLKKGYKRNDVPIAVVERATWPDERIIIGTLENIADKVKEANITKCAQILVGDFIDSDFEKSLLYDKSFSHMFREGQKDMND